MNALKRGLRGVKDAFADKGSPAAADDLGYEGGEVACEGLHFDREAELSPSAKPNLALVRVAALVVAAPLLDGVSGGGSRATGGALCIEMRLLDACGKPKSRPLLLPERRCGPLSASGSSKKRAASETLVWNSTRDLGVNIQSEDVLLVVVRGSGGRNGYGGRALAQASVSGSQLPSVGSRAVLELRRGVLLLPGCSLLVERVPPPPSPLRTVLYLVRHGESAWNEAKREKNVLAMMSYDHPLTMRGTQQAEALRDRWLSEATDTEQKTLPEVREFVEAGAIFSSPLTRALQTAAVALAGHPALSVRSASATPGGLEAPTVRTSVEGSTEALQSVPPGIGEGDGGGAPAELLGANAGVESTLAALRAASVAEGAACAGGEGAAADIQDAEKGSGNAAAHAAVATGANESSNAPNVDPLKGRITLLSSAREVKGIGGLDTVGVAKGSDIARRAAKKLAAVAGAQTAAAAFGPGTVIDPNDASSEWWTTTDDRDSSKEMEERLEVRE